MYGFEYLYNLSVFTKTVLILGTCVIIGLAIRASKKSDTPNSGSQELNTENSQNYTVNKEKQLIKGINESLPTITSDINSCAKECSQNIRCGGFNYINNKCEFVAGTISRNATLEDSGPEVTAYLRVKYT